MDTSAPEYIRILDYNTQHLTGVSILVVLSLLSLVAVLSLLIAIALSAFNTRRSNDRFLFVRTHAAAYFLSLLACWIVQCCASIMNLHWMEDRAVYTSSFCKTQGALKHIADVGVAVWTLVMAGNTFTHLFLELNPKRYAMWIVLVLGWAFIAIVVSAGPTFINVVNRGSFYDVNGVTCWIHPTYEVQTVTLGYMIMLGSALISAILYVMTFLRLRGNLVRNGWKLSLRRVGDSADKYFSNDRAMLAAKQMLLFPIAYAVLIFPLAIARFIEWSGKPIPFELTIFSQSVYLLSGFTNVILFTSTRRILPFSSLRIGNWYLVPSSRPANSDDDSAEKGFFKVTFMEQPTVICTPPGRKESRRPSELDLTYNAARDSFASMYSAREGVWIPPLSSIAPLSSHWSPNTPPLPKSGRLSVYLQGFASAANRI